MPTIRTILGEDIFTQLVPVEPGKEIPVPYKPTAPTTTPVPIPRTPEIIEPARYPMPSTPVKYVPGLVPAQRVITPTEPIISTPTKPAEGTVPATYPMPDMSIPTPPKTPVPTTYEPPPVYRVPPPIFIPPKLPSLPILGRGSISRHGLASTYVKRFINIPELVVYLPTWEGIKPPRIDSRLWRKFGTLSEGVELLGEEEFEETPFGRKAVRPIVARAKLAAGAKEVSKSYKPGITEPEEFYSPIKKKERISKVTGKKQTTFEYVNPNDIGAVKWVG
jgi:hypothetical protein